MTVSGSTFRRARALRWAIAAWLGALGWVAPALAQPPDPSATGQPAPGWVFTPSVRFSGSFDDNATYRGRGDSIASDYMTTVGPRVTLDFTGRRTKFGLNYDGAFLMYRDLGELNSFDQRAVADVRYRITRHLTWFLRDMFSIAPTTDRLELGGIPFVRSGSRMNDGRTGLEAQLTRRTSLTAGVETQWVRFENDEGLRALLRGGQSEGAFLGVRNEINDRVAVGADYSMRHARVGGTDNFDIHNGAGVIDLYVTPDVTVSASVGASRLLLNDLDDRTGLSWRLAAERRGQRASFMAAYFKSFVPSFGFGGTIQNQELAANVRVPFARRRAYWTGGSSWRINTPLTPGEIELRSLWLHTSVGYEFARTLQIEGFYSGIFQDTRRAGGRIDRNQIGFQIVTAAPMRIR